MLKTGTPFSRALQALGAGWRVRSWLNKPIGKLSSRLRLLILAVSVPTSIEDVAPFFNLGQSPVRRYYVDVQEVIKRFVESEASRLFAKLHQLAPLARGGEVSNVWARNLALSLAESDLGVGQWEGHLGWDSNPSWVSEYTLEDITPGRTPAAIRTIAVALHGLIHTIRQAQTKGWVTDLNRLMQEVWSLMTDDHAETEFADVYMRFLKAQQEIAGFSRLVLATSRPNPPEVAGILTPQQVRLWKRYSQLLQGSSPVNTAPPVETTVVDSEDSALNPWSQFFGLYQNYWINRKVLVHEGYYNPPMSSSSFGFD
jgi:hypothetical protein